MKVFELYNRLKAEPFCFAYLDYFSDQSMEALISMQDARVDSPRKIKKKINYLMTECFQNIVRHSEKKHVLFENFFAVRKPGNHHTITSINPVKKSQKKLIAAGFESIADLDQNELRQMYLNTLEGNEFSDKGGAGLGLIDMARKTNRTPRYSFYPLNENYDSFELELILAEQEEEPSDDQRKGISSLELFETLKSKQVLMLQKGDFSQQNVLSLFELLENHLRTNEDTNLVSKKLYLLIELLQNMSKNAVTYNDQKDGIFLIRLTDDQKELIFETGNFVSNKDGDAIAIYLNKITQLNRIELQKLYRKELLKNIDKTDFDGNAGIGLLEILKNSNSTIDHSLDPVNKDIKFISLKATINY